MEYKELTEEIRTAAEAYLDGNASEEQEQSLRAFLAENDGVGLPAGLCALKTMFSGEGELAGMSFDTAAFADSCRSARRSGGNAFWWAGAVAAAAAIVVAVFTFVPQKQQIYGYDIHGQAIVNMDEALENIGSMSLLSELENSMDEAENILNTLVGE